MNENELLEKNSSGISNLELLLIGKKDIECDWFIKKESVDIICKYKRFDLLEFATPMALLLNYKTINQTYLDFILESYKTGDKVNIGSFSPDLYSSNLPCIASYYLTFASHDLIEYIPELSKEELFRKKNGKRLIDFLLDNNRKLTIDKVLSNRVKRDLDVAVYLKLNNIKQDDVDVPVKTDDFINIYLEEYYKSLPKANLSSEELVMLDTVQAFLLDDYLSSDELIDLFVKTYETLIANGYPYALRELEQIAYIKLNNPNFKLEMGKINCFNVGTDSIIMTEKVMNTINHELGHALYHFIDLEKDKDWFRNLKEKITNNSETLLRVKELSDRYKKLNNSILERVNEYYIDYYDFEEDEMIDFINESKQKKIEFYVKKGYKKEDIELLLDKEFSLNEYKKQHKRIKTMELKDIILRCEYGHIIAVNDIVDAVYEGKFWDNKLLLENGEKIDSCSGHGINYYMSEEDQIDEVIAEYSQLLKSKNAKEGIELLEYVFGKEFVKVLNDYYENKIVFAKTYEEGVRKI